MKTRTTMVAFALSMSAPAFAQAFPNFQIIPVQAGQGPAAGVTLAAGVTGYGAVAVNRITRTVSYCHAEVTDPVPGLKVRAWCSRIALEGQVSDFNENSFTSFALPSNGAHVHIWTINSRTGAVSFCVVVPFSTCVLAGGSTP